MTSFGKFIKEEREKRGWSQTEFGAMVKINTPAISRIENDKKQFSAAKLDLLATIFKMDLATISDLYFAEKFAREALKYNCSEKVFDAAKKLMVNAKITTNTPK